MASEPNPESTGGATRTPPAPSAAAARRVSYERKCVVLLLDWWLERVEGQEGKIRVAGTVLTKQMRKAASSSTGNMNLAGRVFRSSAIGKRHDQHAIETEDGYKIRIGRLLNIPRTRDNGFSEKVCKCFEFGFPIQWFELFNPNMEQQNEQAQSKSTANAPRHSFEYLMEQFLNDDLITNLMKYAPKQNDSYSFAGYTSNTDEPAIQSPSNSPDGNAGNMAATGGLYGGRMKMPGKPLAQPTETSCSGQESDQHESMQTDTSKQGLDNHSISSVSVNQNTFCPNSKVDDSILVTSKFMVVEKEGQESDQHESLQTDTSKLGLDNHSISSVSVNQNTCSFCPNSKVDDSILAASKFMSVEKEGQESDQHESMQTDTSKQGLDNHSISSVSVNQNTCSFCPNSKVDDSILATSKFMSVEKEGDRRRVGSGQAEEDADIQHENMQSCSSEYEIVTLPIDSAIVNENPNSKSSDLGTPKCGKASLNLGSTDALELPTERMTPQFGAVRVSEDSPVRRLRSGKVFGTPSGGLMKSRHKKRKIQHEASSQNMIPNEGDTSTADLTSHENDSSAAGVVTKDKQESHDSHRGISAKKAKKKRKDTRKLFWNWC